MACYQKLIKNIFIIHTIHTIRPFINNYLMLLCWSTVPHLFAIIPLWQHKKYTYNYIFVIYLSTKLSILYHLYNESHYVINVLDYFMAGIWFLYDMYFACCYMPYNACVTILFNNAAMFILNMCICAGPRYKILHSIWHLLNAFKAYQVSRLIDTWYVNQPYIPYRTACDI